MCSLDIIFTQDIFYEICSYLSLEDELKINHELRQSLEPHVRKIQIWYRKYKGKSTQLFIMNFKNEMKKCLNVITEMYFLVCII